jgi:hypothetical protein
MVQLGDLGSGQFETAAADDLPVAASDRWLVLLDGGQPVCALAPGSVLDTTTPPPAIIVAPANLDLSAALASPAFAEMEDVNAVVLVEEQRVVGVWSGPSLKMVAEQELGPTRGGGSVLPGEPQIPLIVRSCTYRELDTICATVKSFATKPFPLPGCSNDRHLSAHVFGW